MTECLFKVRLEIPCSRLNGRRLSRVNEHRCLKIQSDLGESDSTEHLRNPCGYQQTTDHATSLMNFKNHELRRAGSSLGIRLRGLCNNSPFRPPQRALLTLRRENGDPACCRTDPQAVPLTDTKLTSCRKNAFAANRTTMDDTDAVRFTMPIRPAIARVFRKFFAFPRRTRALFALRLTTRNLLSRK